MKNSIMVLTKSEITSISGGGILRDATALVAYALAPIMGGCLGIGIVLCLTKARKVSALTGRRRL